MLMLKGEVDPKFSTYNVRSLSNNTKMEWMLSIVLISIDREVQILHAKLITRSVQKTLLCDT